MPLAVGPGSFGDGFAAAVNGAGPPARGRRIEADFPVAVFLDPPAAFVEEPVVVFAAGEAVDDPGLAAVQPVDDVVDDVYRATAAVESTAPAVLDVERVALAGSPAGTLAANVQDSGGAAERRWQLRHGGRHELGEPCSGVAVVVATQFVGRTSDQPDDLCVAGQPPGCLGGQGRARAERGARGQRLSEEGGSRHGHNDSGAPVSGRD